MFKLMIADDNPYILQEICTIIDWEDFDLHIAGTFSNGKALLTAAEKNMPDVVITDISMPVMNGITLATELRKLSQNLKIIFISSYNDFEYAQKALFMQISGYILKPFEQQQLTELMNKVLQELRRESIRRFEENRSLCQVETFRSLALENYMCELLYHPKENDLVHAQLESLEFPPFSSYLLRVVYVTHNKIKSTSYSSITNQIRSVMQGYSASDYRLILLPIAIGQFAVLLIYTNVDLDIANLLAQLNVDIEAISNLVTVMGFSTASEQFSMLPELLKQAQTAATSHSNASVYASVISYEDIQHEADEIDNTETSSPEEILAQDSASKYVTQIRNYVRAHFMEHITTSDVASAVFLSPSYANQRFRAECGYTIFDYITYCRIEEAKRLLSETDEKITMISELVGYSGRVNFYLTFKRSVGMSPTEYRNQRID